MLKISKYLSLSILLFSVTACGGNKTVNNGFSVEVSKKQRQKVPPAQTVVAKSEILLTPVYFEFDKTELSQDAKNILIQNMSAMKNAKQIILVGGCDSRGTEKRNKTLAQNRADAVKDFYVLQGVNPALITTDINLKEQNICTTKNDDSCHSQNRKTNTVIRLF